MRERRNDIPLLVRYFLKRFCHELGKPVPEILPEAMKILTDYSWPGNVRELENTIEHSVVRFKGASVEAGDMPASVRSPEIQSSNRMAPKLFENEKIFLEKALARNAWNKKKTAQELGIGRSTLYSKLRRYGLDKTVMQ